ncbi:bifunctional metallophosphatase/5'-nucleotidase [Nocardiopsis lambiniae]|uniref:Bifunctional metallophosphatase/5'-nucleotidase n=1 Tax=Nocardiopsis lambiniae TaxID=3075539 RepID=A0ABU2MIJ1_9ACTN|nr:bifunctional metallophosphatase/5'-nucleotidase [Nocardiopsis sp. DSM 44743]MDT0331671.1 bifunctional metallophosphatase/5'-nucleotidase [Nocardiopsis sp. DSM 44743]
MSRLVRASAALLLTSAFVVPFAPTAGAAVPMEPSGDADFTLTILHANDPESRLLSASGQEDFGGAARFTTLINDLREAEESGSDGVVTVNSGDMYLPGPEFSASREDGAPFYDAVAARYAGYDAIAMGNHEFDFGPDVYAEFIEQLPDVPVVAANVDVSKEPSLAALRDAGRIAPSTVVEAGGEQVGIVGALYPLLSTISSPRNVVIEDVVAPVQAEVDRLTAEGVDKIIMISHLQGIAYEERVARELTGIDAIVAGGGHEIMANPDDALVPGDQVTAHPGTGAPLSYPLIATNPDGEEVPIVTAGSNYKYVGRLVLDFDAAGDVISVSDRSGTVRVSGAGDDAVAPDADVEAQVTKPISDYVAELAETVVAQSEVDLNGVQNPGVRTQETNLGDLVADGLLDTGVRNAADYGVPEPQIGIQNGGGIRNASVIPAGPLTSLDTYSIAPFANQVAVVPDLPRSQIKELLEQGVAAAPAASGAFMQVAGVNFAYDPARTAQVVDGDGNVTTPGERVRNVILHDGTVLVKDGKVVEGDPITVVTNDFSARGGDNYPFRGADFTVVGSTYQGALERLITGRLEGRITEAAYPEGGAGRIVVGEEATVPDPGTGPSPSPSPSPTDGPTGGPTDGPTGGPSGDPSDPASKSPKPGDGGDGSLPRTGTAVLGLVAAAVVAVGAGGAALYLSRKRKGAEPAGLDG